MHRPVGMVVTEAYETASKPDRGLSPELVEVMVMSSAMNTQGNNSIFCLCEQLPYFLLLCLHLPGDSEYHIQHRGSLLRLYQRHDTFTINRVLLCFKNSLHKSVLNNRE